jgi:hypothetical protein
MVSEIEGRDPTRGATATCPEEDREVSRII